MSKDVMLKSSYTFIGKDINETYNKSNKWIVKNALRELNQKRIKNCTGIQKKKKECLIKAGVWKCPHCLKEVARLTSAHVGEPVSKMIDTLLEEYPDETDICKLDKLLQTKHDTVKIVICCDKCNALLDDTR